MNAVLSQDMEEYINLFYEPPISAYIFLKCFFAKLYERKIPETYRDLDVFLYDMKKTGKYNELLEDIKFKSNGIHLYSNEIEDGIFNLQNVGLLGKKNPSFGKIILEYENIDLSEVFSILSEQQNTLLEDIVDKFINL